MALTSQFNLSVELTKLVPFGPLINTASRGLINLVRELHKSGSDIVAEQDLAEILGRNRIESKFASSFRTAVRKSTIHRLSEAVEIVLEAGAGPTVKRGLTEQAYSSMIIQLSLLTWTHELDSLARALAKALERRVQGSDGYHEFPAQETLKGTLRACREQTSGFMWELMFGAVEIQLKDVGYTSGPTYSRPIPFTILQALLDVFTAVQYFPDEKVLRIVPGTGVVTIVVWAHYLLGLTVGVHKGGESICFGQGHEQVLIDCGLQATRTNSPCIALLNATQQVQFSLTPDPAQEPVLEPACRHPALGYGNRILSFDVEDDTVIRELAHRVVASCLIVVKEAVLQGESSYGDRFLVPSRRRILDSGFLLFEDLNYDPSYLDPILQEPCLLRSSWESPTVSALTERILGAQYRAKKPKVEKTFRRLCYILLTFVNVLDVTACSELPLDIHPGLANKAEQIGLPTVSETFDTLARLLLGTQYDEERVKNAALVSSWGWSIFLSSISSHDPSQLLPEISIRHGVPCRFGERKQWILDSYSKESRQYGNPRGTEGSSRCTIVARPGDTVTLQSLSTAKQSKYFIDVSGSAFEVMIHLECDADAGRKYDQWVSVRLGFRGLQELWWGAFQLPECSHSSSRLGDEAVVPDDTTCFSGLSVHLINSGAQLDNHEGSEDGWVYAGLVAGNHSARWILLQKFQGWFSHVARRARDAKPGTDGTVVLRGDHCCLACAMEMARNLRNGKIIGLIL